MNGLFTNSLKSPRQIFMEEGILFYPAVFEGEELARLRESCESALTQFLIDADARGGMPEKFSVMRNLNDPRWHEARQDHLARILEVIADPRCLGPVEQIFRGPSLFRTTSLFFNPRTEHYDGDWHRDLQFTLKRDEAKVRETIATQSEPDGLQFQIALVDNDDVEYVPFSAGRYDSPEEYRIRAEGGYQHSRDAGMPNAMRVRQRAGDAIVFNPNGLHRGRYYAENPRRTLMLTYTPRSAPCFDKFAEQPWCRERGYLDGVSPRARAYIEDFIGVYSEMWDAKLQPAVATASY